MKRKKEKLPIDVKENIEIVDYTNEMESAYIDYALSVIASRALADVRDGLKPVHRRTLFSMNELNLQYDKPYRKSARVVGDVLGKYHPHGDSAVYNSMVRMAQPFSLKNPLIDGHGNFGSIDGDSAAAMRYTEARLTRISGELLRDLDKNIVEFVPNFDNTMNEPSVLPCRFPNLLVNGSSGIAVGMASNIPPHNLRECINATLAYMKNNDISYKKLLSLLKGPDFPTGGIIINKDDLIDIYTKGKGVLKLRAKTHIEDLKGGKFNIVVTEIPYSSSGSVSKLVEGIIELVRDKKIDNIADVRDESNLEGLRIVIETKKNTNPDKLLNKLFKMSKLQDNLNVDLLTLIPTDSNYGNSNLRPKRLSLKEILHHFVDFQKEIVTKKTEFDLNKSEKRLEIVDGLIEACNLIDVIIDTIRGSETDKDAKMCLISGDTSKIEFKTKANEKKASKFNFTERQADSILDMRLRRLSGLQINNLVAEKESLEMLIKECKEILSNEDKLLEVIENDLKQISKTYGEKRKTEIDNLSIDEELLVEEKVVEELYILLDEDNYIKAIDKSSYSKLTEEEIAQYVRIIHTNMSDKLCVFTSCAKLNQVKIEDIPKLKIKDKGVPLDTLASLEYNENSKEQEHILFMDCFNNMKDKSIVFLTSKGFAKVIEANEYKSFRSSVKSTKVSEDDKIVLVKCIKKDLIDSYKMCLFTSDSFVLKFELSSIPNMKKEAQGVKCIALNPAEEIICCGLFIDENSSFVLSTNENLKTEIKMADIKMQNRNTKGKKAITGKKFDNYEVKFLLIEESVDNNNLSDKENEIDEEEQLDIFDI